MLSKIKKTFSEMDKGLLFIILGFCIFGLCNIVTASSREAVVGMDQSVYYYFYRHLIVLIVGFAAFIFLINIDTSHYSGWILLPFGALAILNLVAIIHGKFTRGALNWIGLGFFNLQPSEFSKPVIIAILAVYIEKYGKRLRNPRVNHKNMIWGFCGLGLIIPAIVFFQKDLGTMLIQLSIFGVFYLVSPILAKEKWKVMEVLCVVVVFLGLILYAKEGAILTPEQKARFNYFNPCEPSKFAGKGYQVCNAYVAINLGGLTGVGIGKSTQKYSYIPEAHTDMVFAILAEEYGFIGGAIVIFLYGVILYHILMLSSRASTIRGKYICLGVATYFFAHVFINLGGMFGLIPLTGVPLPFLSYGGSFTISLLAALGMVERVHIETKQKMKHERNV